MSTSSKRAVTKAVEQAEKIMPHSAIMQAAELAAKSSPLQEAAAAAERQASLGILGSSAAEEMNAKWRDLSAFRLNSSAMREMQEQATKWRELADKITRSPAMEAARKLSEQSSALSRQLQLDMKPLQELSKQIKPIHMSCFDLPGLKAVEQLGTGWAAIQKQQDLFKSLSGGIAACEAAKVALSPQAFSPVMTELSKIKQQFAGTAYDTVTPAIRESIVSDIDELETIAKDETSLPEKLPVSATKLSLTFFTELPNAVNAIIVTLSDIHKANQTIAEENKSAITRLIAVTESNAEISKKMLEAGGINTDAIVELNSISKNNLEAAQAQLDIIKNNYTESTAQGKRSDRKTNWALGIAVTSVILTLIMTIFSCWLAHRDSDSTTNVIIKSQESNSNENRKLLDAINNSRPSQPPIGNKQK